MASVSAIELKPGETKTIFNLAHGGRITGIIFDKREMYKWTDRDIDIKISWDNETVPAVYCPLADFFGYAFGQPSMQSLLLGSQGKVNYCFFPMPFDKQATIQLINRNTGNDTVALPVKATIYYTNRKRVAATEGKFYTSWKSNKLFKEDGPHIILNAKGKGHYVGTILLGQGIKPGMTYFFEGDDSTSIDGIFRIHGTGSEDYFNGGWYALPDRWDTKMSLPLHGSLEYSLPFCRTGGYRLFLSDKMSFEKSIFHSIEHGPVQNETAVDYTSLAFYYNDIAASAFVKPTNELSKINVPDTMMMYPQLMDFNISGAIDTRTMWGYNTGGESFIFTARDQSAVRISLDEIPRGGYKIFGDFVKSPEGCAFSLWQGQNQLSDWIPGDSSLKERIPQLYLADIVLNDFRSSLTIKFKTTAEKKNFFLNRLIFVRKNPAVQ
ncbi:MAG: glycoside hydrolase family 172 protein [Ferruginibacter sp.]